MKFEEWNTKGCCNKIECRYEDDLKACPEATCDVCTRFECLNYEPDEEIDSSITDCTTCKYRENVTHT